MSAFKITIIIMLFLIVNIISCFNTKRFNKTHHRKRCRYSIYDVNEQEPQLCKL